MKKLITLSLVAITTLFIGCADSTSGNDEGNSNNSSIASDASASSTPSNDEAKGFIEFDARNLSGYTVFVEDTNGISGFSKEVIFIFQTGTQVKIVDNRNDGSQMVYEGTYNMNDSIAGIYNININAEVGYSLFLEDNYNVKENQLGLYVTNILPNESNGVVIKDNTPTESGLSITSIDDVKGYTITSNLAHPGTTGATMQLSIAFKCDGSFDYTTDIGYKGTSTIINDHGDEVYVDEHFGLTRLGWYYTDEEGERNAGQIETDVNNQLLEGACWSGANSDGACFNDLHIESISSSGC